MMPMYLVRQRRPQWVCYIQEIAAENEEEAIDKFYDEFDPNKAIVEGEVWRVERGPCAAFRREMFADISQCADEN